MPHPPFIALDEQSEQPLYRQIYAAELGIKAAAVSSYSLIKLERGGLILGYTASGEKQIKSGGKQLAAAMNGLNIE